MNTDVHPIVRQPRRRLIAARTSAIALLAGMLLTAAPTVPAGAGPPSPASPDQVASGIDRFMDAQIEDSAIPGAAVAVIRGDQVLMVRGYGHDATGRPVTGDSLFRIASLSKSFTALAVMQLVDAGRLHLDDPVQQHLPAFQLADPRAGQVTVRQLLDHTSGLTDAMVPELSRTQPRTTHEATTSLQSAHLATTPGTSWSYHNPNYQVAAHLVEVLSGQPFDAYLRRHVLDPAGMIASTSTTTDDRHVPGLTDGHVTAYGHAFTAPGLGTFIVGEGDVVSTAADMARWLIVHANGGRTADGTRLVSAEGTRLLHTPSAREAGYALGWSARGPADAPIRLEHSGNLHTFTSEQAIWPESGYGVVLLFNAGSPMILDQNAIVHGVFDIAEGTTPPSSGPHLAAQLDSGLAVLTIVALTFGAFGVARAGRWSRRRYTPVRRALTLLPAVMVLAAGPAFPHLVEALLSRDVTWRAAAYGWPALVVFVLAALLAAAATLLVRAWHWARASRVDPRPRAGPVDHVSQMISAEIAGMFNAAGLTTGKGKPFTAGGVARVRDAYKIFGPRTVAVQAGEVSVKQAAAELGIPADAIYNWLRLGQVPARRGPSGRWCIPWDDASQEIYRQKVAGSYRLKPVQQTQQTVGNV